MQVPIQEPSGSAGEAEHMFLNREGRGETRGLLMTISSPTGLDIGRMREAFAEVIQRHGALRTAFFLNQGKLGQCVYPFLDFEVGVVDLEAEADPERKAYEMSLTACEEFDIKLEQLPLFRVTVFGLGNDAWSFSFISHDMYDVAPFSNLSPV